MPKLINFITFCYWINNMNLLQNNMNLYYKNNTKKGKEMELNWNEAAIFK